MKGLFSVSDKVAASKAILDALKTVDHFVTEITGEAPTSLEIASALKRYFVLKEILEHIVMDRENA